MNPRYPCEYAAFRVRCFQPLSHLSKPAIPGRGDASWLMANRPGKFGTVLLRETREPDKARVGPRTQAGPKVAETGELRQHRAGSASVWRL